MSLCVFIQDEFIGTREEPDIKGASMDSQADGQAVIDITADGDALVINDVSKTFGKETQNRRSLRLPWKKKPDKPDDKPDDSGGANDHKDKAKGPKKVVAIDHVSVNIKHHEIFGILGANGSGKSTLIRLVSTLLTPDTGNVTVFGHDIRREEMAVKRLINRVSVDAAFFKKLSPMENLIYAARLYGLDAGEARKLAVEILTKLGIEKDSIYRPLEDMSRGMQQKVAIARAFLTAPILLLLDEPTTGLDPRSKRDVQEFVLNLRQNHDTTIVLTTHDMAEADRLCDRIAILHKGKIVALDTPTSLKASLSPNGHEIDMEDVFMHYTGKTAEDLKNEEE
jgi:ABC-2 type transport system ATP-binding protein